MERQSRVPRWLLVAVWVLVLQITGVGQAMNVGNPDEIKVLGMVSFDEEGAAWLRIGRGRDVLVTPGYQLTKDLRVTAIRPEGVILYRAVARQYHCLAPADTFRIAEKNRNALLWTEPMPLWKVVRMIALAYRKDYIAHHACQVEVMPKRHAFDMNEMLNIIVNPHHRWHGREGVIYISPVLIGGTAWSRFNEQVRTFRSHRLTKWYPVLGEKGSILSDGKDLNRVLKDIEYKTGIPIRWAAPVKAPLFCSFKDRPWHEIIANIVLFNGLGLALKSNGIDILGAESLPQAVAAPPTLPGGELPPLPNTSAAGATGN